VSQAFIHEQSFSSHPVYLQFFFAEDAASDVQGAGQDDVHDVEDSQTLQEPQTSQVSEGSQILLPLPLLMPPSHVNFASRLILAAEDGTADQHSQDLFASQDVTSHVPRHVASREHLRARRTPSPVTEPG